VLASHAISDQLQWNSVGFFNSIVTINETWIHIYDPETKEQSKEWRHIGSPHPKKFMTGKSSSKLLEVCLPEERILPVVYQEKV
jgi:hypothetical protein